jgi:hypothetical protein
MHGIKFGALWGSSMRSCKGCCGPFRHFSGNLHLCYSNILYSLAAFWAVDIWLRAIRKPNLLLVAFAMIIVVCYCVSGSNHSLTSHTAYPTRQSRFSRINSEWASRETGPRVTAREKVWDGALCRSRWCCSSPQVITVQPLADTSLRNGPAKGPRHERWSA